jgi:hypothetical protein
MVRRLDLGHCYRYRERYRSMAFHLACGRRQPDRHVTMRQWKAEFSARTVAKGSDAITTMSGPWAWFVRRFNATSEAGGHHAGDGGIPYYQSRYRASLATISTANP